MKIINEYIIEKNIKPIFKVWDGLELRMREILAGTGEVRIGVGYRIEFIKDVNGVIRREEVPVYKIQTF